MTNIVAENCPGCNASDGAKAQFAAAKVAEHVKEKARQDGNHRDWIEKYTENGTISVIREALADHGRPRN